MDSDGYPDDDELEQIEKWDHHDFAGLGVFVHERWKYRDCGYWTQEGRKLNISTGGWSGNESLMSALEANTMFWAVCWQSSKRGGHYEFELPEWAVKSEPETSDET